MSLCVPPQERCIIHMAPMPCYECSPVGSVGVQRLGPVKEPMPRAGIAGIFEAIVEERKFQDNKYGKVLEPFGEDVGMGAPIGVRQGPGGHELGAWLIIAEKELDEAKDALVHGGSKKIKGRNTIRAELVQLAATCVAALEQHGLQEKE